MRHNIGVLRHSRKQNISLIPSISYVEYEAFYDIPEDIRRTILRKLGISSGAMRGEAKRYNPPCIIAFHEDKPIGWASYLTPRFSPYPELNVFVSVPYRKKGIGSTLASKILSLYNSSKERKVKSFPYNEAGKKLFGKFSDQVVICNEYGIPQISNSSKDREPGADS